MRLRRLRIEGLEMIHVTNLLPMAPFVGGLVALYLTSRRGYSAPGLVAEGSEQEVQVFQYPRGILKAIFASAVILPLVFFLLPDEAVQDARPLFNFGALVLGGLLLYAWAYLHQYRIVVERGVIKYGAFFLTSVDLRRVTSIKYFWVGNGINLKLFDNNKRIAIFEGGIEDFDAFAKTVRRRLPDTIHAETIGKASF